MHFKLKKKSSMCAESYLHRVYFYYWELEAAKMSRNKGQIKYIMGFLITQIMMQQ